MSERLDLSGLQIITLGIGGCYGMTIRKGDQAGPNIAELLAEALRAQASEDALRHQLAALDTASQEGAVLIASLRKRVEVLEGALGLAIRSVRRSAVADTWKPSRAGGE